MKFKEKPPEIIEKQLGEAESQVNQKIIPPSQSRENVLDMSGRGLKEQFPKRYEIYLDLLRKRGRRELKTDELLEANKWLGILNSLDDYIDQYEKEISEDPRHPIQQEVFRALRDFLEKGNIEGYVKLPTGSGKTILFKRFLEAIKQRSLIAVPNNILVSQTVRQLSGSAIGEGVGVLNQHSKDYDAGSIVTTYASLIRNINSGMLKPADFSCLILDEAHKALGKESAEVVDKFKHAIRIGFTATPEYSETKTLKTLLNNEVYRMEVAEAIRAGALSHARTLAVRTNIDLSSIGIQKGEYIEKGLAEKINSQARNQLAVDYYQSNFSGKDGVVYCVGISHAETMARMFNEAGISTEVISGKTRRKDREEILARFKKGEIKLLCNADILIEGFDADNAAVCLNLRPTMSAVIAEQRGGRVLRLNEKEPDKVGYIVDFLDDDKLAANLSRPYPILYREILGATAVPRTIVSESFSESPGKNTETSEEPKEQIPSLRVLGTEEQFQEILNKKRRYSLLKAGKQKEKESRSSEKIRENKIRETRKLLGDYLNLERLLSNLRHGAESGLNVALLKKIKKRGSGFSYYAVRIVEEIMEEVEELFSEYETLGNNLRSDSVELDALNFYDPEDLTDLDGLKENFKKYRQNVSDLKDKADQLVNDARSRLRKVGLKNI